MNSPSTALRPGNKSLENIVRTDERYGHDDLWLGPRGRGCFSGFAFDQSRHFDQTNHG